MTDNTVLNTGSGGDTIASDDIGGVKFQRVKLIQGADNTNDGDVSKAAPLSVYHVHNGATPVNFFATGAAAGATGVETAITLSKSPSAGGTVTTGTSFVVTSGKRFRITSASFSSRGNATATAQVTVFSVRVNTGGATTTSSAIFFQGRTGNGAAASSYDRFVVDFGGIGPEIAGDGTLTFGVTANSVFVTNAPTWDVLITGVEF